MFDSISSATLLNNPQRDVILTFWTIIDGQYKSYRSKGKVAFTHAGLFSGIELCSKLLLESCRSAIARKEDSS